MIEIEVNKFYGVPSYYSVMPEQIFDALELASLKGDKNNAPETKVPEKIFSVTTRVSGVFAPAPLGEGSQYLFIQRANGRPLRAVRCRAVCAYAWWRCLYIDAANLHTAAVCVPEPCHDAGEGGLSPA